jgi:hypothetical protein
MSVEYTPERAEIAELTKRVVTAAISDETMEIGDELMAKLNAETIDQDDLFAKAIIRYLLHRKVWPYNLPAWSAAMNKFFSPRADREEITPHQYVEETSRQIKVWFDYEMPVLGEPKRPRRKEGARKAVKEDA